MLLNIDSKTIWSYQILKKAYFHPKSCLLSDKHNNILMTLQTISGSDFFGELQFCCSNDSGKSWQQLPELVPNMGRIPVCAGIEEGVCDVVPDYHPQTKTVLAVGHNVYYRNGRLYDSLSDWSNENGPVLQRYIIYTVRDQNGNWNGIRKYLKYDKFADCSMFSCGCSQKVILPDGNILIPVTFGTFSQKDRMVCSLLCSFDGDNLTPLKHGNILRNPIRRGLLEPSMVKFQNKYYMTLRAEDEHGYVSVSKDGINWKPLKAWQWENGKSLIMSTTQQHWLILGGKLYLIYTRKNSHNQKVMRWRAPLLIAEFDAEKLCLKKGTEQIIFPMRHHPDNPDAIGLMGNFHPLALSDTEAIITVGEMRPGMGFSGDTLLARITA